MLGLITNTLKSARAHCFMREMVLHCVDQQLLKTQIASRKCLEMNGGIVHFFFVLKIDIIVEVCARACLSSVASSGNQITFSGPFVYFVKVLNVGSLLTS